MKKFWDSFKFLIGTIIGFLAALFIVMKNKKVFVEKAIDKIAPIAPSMEIEEYKAKVLEKSKELTKEEASTIMDLWTKRFGG